MKTFFLSLVVILISTIQSQAQELQFSVTLNHDQMVGSQKTDPQSMQQLQTYISEFLNNQKWTNDAFKNEEKIKCKLIINLLSSPAQGNYQGNAQLVITRPVYNSNYETVLFSYVDKKFNFNYLPTTQLFFNENSYTEELPYVLAFYANIALIFDYDSFSKLGGNPYIQKAQNLANIARNSSTNKGAWDMNSDTRNRYWLMENLNSPQFVPFRESMYTYYRQGLDVATQSPATTQTKVLEVLTTIKAISQLRSTSILINSFFDAKSDELVRILMEAPADQKQKAFTIITSLDPTKTQFYQKLMM